MADNREKIDVSAPTLSTWKQLETELDFERVDRWFIGEHLNRYPRSGPIVAADIVSGWEPTEKLIHADTKVLAFGSCFAEYFIKYLTQNGYNRWQLPQEKHGLSDENLLLSMGQTFENIFVITQQIRWAFGEFTPTSALWFTKDRAYFEATEERRENIRRSFAQADVVIITLGLSEVWFDSVANEAMWRPITARLYEKDRHTFRKATTDETLRELGELRRLAQTFLPEKKFILTLSPIPLLATFRDQSAVTANQASKATLRAALDEFIFSLDPESRERIHYFPSYELALTLFGNPFKADNRHVRDEVAATVLQVFSLLYTDLPIDEEILSRPVSARVAESKLERLEAELDKKEAVIRELDKAARERLELIERLERERR